MTMTFPVSHKEWTQTKEIILKKKKKKTHPPTLRYPDLLYLRGMLRRGFVFMRRRRKDNTNSQLRKLRNCSCLRSLRPRLACSVR